MKRKLLLNYYCLQVLFAILPCSLVMAQFPGQVLLDVSYENGQLNSGISGVNATNAIATDAAYIISPGATGQYAIAHKIVQGNAGYYSDGNYRSEADALANAPARFSPGDERRYEFSVYLKDWQFNANDPTETNLFQLKLSQGEVPLQVRTTRNNIVLRFALANSMPNVVVVSNASSYANQWIHFRIDVLWATTATGYMKTSVKLPGQSDYVVVDNKTNYLTYNSSGSSGQVGYIKWGLYVAPTGSTKIAYHDDIKVINLNQAPTGVGMIWANSVSDANPAYLDGPYTKAATIYNQASYNNSSDCYMHPYVNFIAPQNIVYTNSTSPAPNPTDNVLGTPWSDFSRTTLQAGGATNGGTTPGPSGRYLLAGWNTSGSGSPTAIDLNQYYEFKMEPTSGYYFNFSTILFTVLRGSTTNPNTFVLRSSLDNFSSNIGSLATITNTTATTAISFDASPIQNVSGPVTFRLYAYGATGTGTMLVGLNDFQFLGQVLPAAPAINNNELTANWSKDKIQVNWTTSSVSNTDFFDIQFSKDGKSFATVKTIKPLEGNNYQTEVPLSAYASILAFPVLVGFIGLRQHRKFQLIFLGLFAVFMFATIPSCKKAKNIPTGSEGPMFIRIKQVDKNGNATYSKIISISQKQ